MDDAATRYGRVGVHFTIDRPNYEGIKSIAKIHLSRLGRSTWISDFDYDIFAKVATGTTGADIAGIISKTFWDRYRRITLDKEKPYQLTTEHFVDAAGKYSKTVEPFGFGNRP